MHCSLGLKVRQIRVCSLGLTCISLSQSIAKDAFEMSFDAIKLTKYVFGSLVTLTSGSCWVISLLTGILSYSSYLNGLDTALKVILYFLMSVPRTFLRFTVKEPSLIGDFKFISKTSF